MTQTQNLSADARAAARLGDSHGYRIHGDLACLNAELAIHESRRAQAEQWALQLWACDAPYGGGGALRGTKIAEVPLAVSDEPTMEPQRHYAEAFARLPAGDRDYSMVLVLASGAEGAFDRVHDFANYPAREHFSVPKLYGEVAAIGGDGQVTLRIESVENPRSSENLSGTLALEVWGLEEPYNGGPFSGASLAGVEIGRLPGGARSDAVEHTLTLAATSTPYPHCVLMLREWTATGYVTRDFRALSLEQGLESPPPALDVAHALEVLESAPVGAVAAEPEKTAQPVVETQPAPSNNQGLVSASHASLEELSVVPGLNRKLAAEIIKARPYRNFEDLMRVRGIGEKVLRRLRSVLTI
jgi:hypothetical protein